MRQRLSAGHRTLCAVLCTLLASTVVLAGSAPDAAKASDPWQPIRGLLGSWEGQTKGEPGSGECEREYRLVLNDKFIRVTNKSTYPPQEKNPKGEVHEDTGFISYDKAARKLVMRQFHVEGFVNHYVLDNVSDDGRKVVFATVAIENIPSGWRGRETYEFVGPDEFVETFALAEPGKDFAIYSETRFRRKPARKSDSHPLPPAGWSIPQKRTMTPAVTSNWWSQSWQKPNGSQRSDEASCR